MTNGFSKKIKNHKHAIALHLYVLYLFILYMTPAIEAGIADHVWTLEEIASLIENDLN